MLKAKPYKNTVENILSVTLISVECVVFLLALIIVSDMNKTEKYNTQLMKNFVIGMITIVLAVAFPLAILSKVSSRIQKKIFKISELEEKKKKTLKILQMTP